MIPHLIDADNPSLAWLQALKHLSQCGGECNNLVVSIRKPTVINPTIQQAAEKLLEDFELLSLRQVTYTIFPKSLYSGCGRDANMMFDRYNREDGVYQRLKRRYPGKSGWGTYFRRMTHHASEDGYGGGSAVNQLAEIIEMLSSRPRVYKAAYTISILVPGVDGKRVIGGPCLNYVALQLQHPRIMNMLAIYRNHDFVQRAYGNYLGLGYLMEFLCEQTGYVVGSLTCVSSHASIRNLGARQRWPGMHHLRAFASSL